MNIETDQHTTPEPTTAEKVPAESGPPEPEHSSVPALPTNDWTTWVWQGLRASALRPLRALPEGPSAWQMMVIAGISMVIATGLARFEIDGAVDFSLRSWLFSWASTGLLVAGVWLIVNFRSGKALHTAPVAAWYLLSSVAALPMILVSAVLSIAAARGAMPQWWIEGRWYAWAIYAGFFAWYGASAWRIARAIHSSTVSAVALVLLGLTVMTLDTTLLRVSSWEPAYVDDDTSDREFLSLSQEVFETQQSLLNNTLLAIKPTAGGQRQIYGLIYAPYSDDVFLRESIMVQEVLEQRFGAQDRVVRLVNHATVTTETPWATNRNLERSLEALAKAMDTEHDVLVLYLTSHGGADFVLATEHYPLEVKSLTADQLRSTLDKVGIRNRVIVISACYSGGWINPLKDDYTLVMTAADKDHTSYGCGSKSTLTYFGQAVFDEQLRKTVSFEDAFKAAVPIIAARETEAGKSDGFSNPQLSVGKEIQTVLREWAAQQSSPVPNVNR